MHTKKFITAFVLSAFVLFNIFSILPVSIAHANDIDILQVSAIPNSGVVGPGQTLEIHFAQPDHMDDVVLDPSGTCTINGKTMNNFENLGNGEYRLRYNVSEGDPNQASGQVQFSCALTNAAHQQSTITSFT